MNYTSQYFWSMQSIDLRCTDNFAIQCSICLLFNIQFSLHSMKIYWEIYVILFANGILNCIFHIWSEYLFYKLNIHFQWKLPFTESSTQSQNNSKSSLNNYEINIFKIEHATTESKKQYTSWKRKGIWYKHKIFVADIGFYFYRIVEIWKRDSFSVVNK